MMKSNKWKIIQLKDPKLIKIRANLRKLLKKTVSTEINRLGSLQNLYTMKRVKRELTPSQRKREISLNQKRNKLQSARDDSLLSCSYGAGCMSYKKNHVTNSKLTTIYEDMVWHPLLKKWICINCFNHRYKTEEQKERERQIFKEIEEENKEFDGWLDGVLEAK